MANKINLMINEIFKKTQKTRNMLKQESEYKQTVDDFVEKLKDIREILADNIDENNGDHQPAKEQLDLLKEIEEDIDIMSEGKTKIIKKYDELIDEKLLNSDITYDSLEINLKDKLLQVIEDQREDKDKIVKQEEILNTIDRRELTIYKNDKKKIVVLDDKGNTINRKRTMIRTNDGDIKPLNMQINNGEINFKKQRKLTEIRIDQFSYNPQENLQSKDIENLSQIDQLRMLDDHMNFKHYTKVVNYKNKFNDGINRDFFTLMYNYSELDEKDFKNLESMKDLKLSGISNLNTNLIKLGNAKEFISGGEHDIRLKPEYIYFKKVSGRPEWRKVLYDKNKNINWRRTFQDINDFYTFIGFSGNLYIDNELKQKQFKMIHDSGPGVIKDIQYNGSNKKIELNDFGFNKKMITLNTVFNGQIQNAKDILQDFGYKNEVVDINKTLFFDLETTGSGKVIEYGFSVSNTGKKFSIINTNVTEKELKEIQGTTQLKNYKELYDIIQSLQNTTDDYIEKDGVVYYKQSSDFDQIFERASKKLGFEKNKLNTLGGYNIKNFDIPLLQEMLESKQIKSNLLTDMVKRQTIDVYDDGYIAYILKRKGINVQSQSQEQIQSVLKLGESKKHLGQFDQSTTQQIADYLQTNIGGIKTNKKLVELEQNIINQKNPLKILQNRFDKNQITNIMEQQTKESEEKALKYMKSFNINLNDEEYDLFKSHIYRRVKKTINGYDLMINGHDIGEKTAKGQDFNFLNIQEELRKYLNVDKLSNNNIEIDLQKSRYKFLNKKISNNSPFLRQANIIGNMPLNVKSEKETYISYQNIQKEFVSGEYQNFQRNKYAGNNKKSVVSLNDKKINLKELSANKSKIINFKLKKDLQFQIEIDALSSEKTMTTKSYNSLGALTSEGEVQQNSFYNIEKQYKEVGLESVFKEQFYKGEILKENSINKMRQIVFEQYKNEIKDIKNLKDSEIEKYAKKFYESNNKLYSFYTKYYKRLVPDYEKIRNYEEMIKDSQHVSINELHILSVLKNTDDDIGIDAYVRNGEPYEPPVQTADIKKINSKYKNVKTTKIKVFPNGKENYVNKREVEYSIRVQLNHYYKEAKDEEFQPNALKEMWQYKSQTSKNKNNYTEYSKQETDSFFRTNKNYSKNVSDDINPIGQQKLNSSQENEDEAIKKLFKNKRKEKHKVRKMKKSKKNGIVKLKSSIRRINYTESNDKNVSINTETSETKINKVSDFFNKKFNKSDDKKKITKTTVNKTKTVKVKKQKIKNFLDTLDQIYKIRIYNQEKSFYEYEFDNNSDDNPTYKGKVEYKKRLTIDYDNNFLGLGEQGKVLQKDLQNQLSENIGSEKETLFFDIYSKIKKQSVYHVLKKFGLENYNMQDQNQQKVVEEFYSVLHKLNRPIFYDLIDRGYTAQQLLEELNYNLFENSINKYKKVFASLSYLSSKDIDFILKNENFLNGKIIKNVDKVIEENEKLVKPFYNKIDNIIKNKLDKFGELEEKIFQQESSLRKIKSIDEQIQTLNKTINSGSKLKSVVKKITERRSNLIEEKAKLLNEKTENTKILSILNKQKNDIEKYFKKNMKITVDQYIDATFEDNADELIAKYKKILLKNIISNDEYKKFKKINKEIAYYRTNKKYIIKNSDLQENYKTLLDELGVKKGQNHEEVLKNLLTFYNKLYIDKNKYASYQDIRDFMNFMYDNFEYTSNPNNVLGMFVSTQLDLKSNQNTLKDNFINIKNNLNVKENQKNILNIFGFDYNNSDNIEKLKKIQSNDFNAFMKEMVKWKSEVYYNNIGQRNFLQVMRNPKGFNYEEDKQFSMDYQDITDQDEYFDAKNKVEELQYQKYADEDSFKDSTIDPANLSDQQYNEILKQKKTGDYIEDEKNKTQNKNKKIKTEKTKQQLKKEKKDRKIRLKKEKNKFDNYQEYSLNDVFKQNKIQNYNLEDLVDNNKIQVNFFQDYQKKNFDNTKNAKLFFNLLRIYVKSKESGEEFYLKDLFDDDQIKLFKGDKVTHVKDFEDMLQNFGKILSNVKNLDGETVDLSYMIPKIIRKKIKPFDFNYLNKELTKKALSNKVPFIKLSVKQNDFQKNTLYKISELITSRFESGELVKDFDQVLREARSITDDIMLKQFDQEDIGKYYQTFNKSNTKNDFNLQQQLLYQMEKQQDMMNKKIFAGKQLKQLYDVKDVNKRNEQLNNFFKKNFSEYYSADEEEILTGRGFLKQQLLDITYNYDDYSKGIDVTSPEYRKQNDDIKKSKKIIKQLIDSLEYENELDKEIKKKQDKKAIKNLDSNTHNKNYQSKIGKTQINKSKQVDDGQKDITNEVKKMLDSETKQFDSGFKKMINYFQNNKKGKIGLTITQSAIVGQSILGQKQKQKQEAKAQTLYGQQKQGSYEIEEVQFLGRPQYGVDLYQPTYYEDLVDDVIQSHSETYNYDERLVNLYDGRLQKMATTGGDPYEEQSGY